MRHSLGPHFGRTIASDGRSSAAPVEYLHMNNPDLPHLMRCIASPVRGISTKAGPTLRCSRLTDVPRTETPLLSTAGVAPNASASVRTGIGSLPPAMVPSPSLCWPDSGAFSRALETRQVWTIQHLGVRMGLIDEQARRWVQFGLDLARAPGASAARRRARPLFLYFYICADRNRAF